MSEKVIDDGVALVAALFPSDADIKARRGEWKGQPAVFVEAGAMYERPTYQGKGGVIGMLTAIRDAFGGTDIDEAGESNQGGCETCDWGSFYATEFVVWGLPR